MGKTICISIPCYNEAGNVSQIVSDIDSVFKNELSDYDYLIQFIDNNSTDGTRDEIREICQGNDQVRAIFNAKNFPRGSAWHGLMEAEGDCVIFIPCDFQVPIEIIPELIEKWEQGFLIVCAVKTRTEEKGAMALVRRVYYRIVKYCAALEKIEYIPQFTGSGLYDKSFMDFLKSLNEPMPFMRSLVAEYGYNMDFVTFLQPLRKRGRSSMNLYELYDSAMRSFTMNTKILIRASCFIGVATGFIALLGGLIYAIVAFTSVVHFQPWIFISLLLSFFAGLILFFIGMVGEYVLAVNARTMRHPFVVEEDRINFHSDRSAS